MDGICRLCAEFKQPHDFIGSINEVMDIKEMLIKCCSWNSYQRYDTMPNNVCGVCLGELRQCWDFHERVSQAQIRLIQLFDGISCTDSTTEQLEILEAAEIPEEIESVEIYIETVAAKSEIEIHSIHETNQEKNPSTKTVLVNQPSKSAQGEAIYVMQDRVVDQQCLQGDSFDIPRHFTKIDVNPNGTIKVERIREHNLYDWTIMQYICYRCETAFDDFFTLMEHFNSIHPKEKLKLSCSVCANEENLYDSADYIEHVTKVHYPHLFYCCYKCQKFFLDPRKLQTHLNFHPNAMGSYNCQQCGKKFRHYRSLWRHSNSGIHDSSSEPHLGNHSNEEPGSSQTNKTSETSIDSSNPIRQFVIAEYFSKSDVDADGTISVDKIHQHNLCDWSAVKILCFNCEGFSGDYVSFTQHFRVQHGKTKIRFGCALCSEHEILHSMRKFVDHVVGEHYPHLFYCCYKCQKFFYDKVDLRKHLIVHPTDYKSHICSICGKSFRFEQNLHKHTRTHVPKELRPIFECYLCKRMLSSRHHLRAHINKTHIKVEKAFVCEKCGKNFIDSDGLRTHMISHSTDRPFVCDICDKSFKLSRDLQRHKSIHEDFKPHGCHICGLRFYQKSSIRGHFMRHHSSDLPYKCSFCDEQFHTKILLRRHHKRHYEYKPFACSQCTFQTNSRANLKAHEKRIHSMNLLAFS